MNGDIFLDTNIILYLYSIDEIEKRSVCQDLVNVNECIISVQVLNEISNILRKKFRFDYIAISTVIDELIDNFEICIIEVTTIKKAIQLASRYKYSYYDSLILSTAIENNCNLN